MMSLLEISLRKIFCQLIAGVLPLAKPPYGTEGRNRTGTSEETGF
jgi:hypothetical protein